MILSQLSCMGNPALETKSILKPGSKSVGHFNKMLSGEFRPSPYWSVEELQFFTVLRSWTVAAWLSH